MRLSKIVKKLNGNYNFLISEKQKLLQKITELETELFQGKVYQAGHPVQTSPLVQNQRDELGVYSPLNTKRSTVELKKSTASPEQTVSGKDLSNPLKGGYSPMNINRDIVGSRIPTTSLDQTVSSKGEPNPLMAENLPKISQKCKELVTDALS